MRLPTFLLVLFLLGGPAAAQSFDVIPEISRATVGDTIALQLRVQLGTNDAALLDLVPRLLDPAPAGLRVLSADSLTRTGNGTYEGRAEVAFFRPGRRTVPAFALPYRRAAVVLSAVLESEPVTVEVVPVLPAGNPPLQDIKGLESPSGPNLLPLALALALLLSAGYLVARRRRRRPARSATQPARDVPRPTPTPYEIALDHLAYIEQEQWPARGEVARHYVAVTDVLRGYLADAERIPARERTSAELLRALPARLTPNGVHERCRGLLSEADLVKFAGVRPDISAAAGFLQGVRDLLERWRETSAANDETNAVR